MLAIASGKIISKYFRTNVNVESKDDDSPVTIADKKAEETIRNLITKEYPSHGIIGEEFGRENEDAEYVWVLDPIDGTKSFICGSVIFGSLIALMHKGKPVLGVFNQPVLGEFLIGDNTETLLNGKKVTVRECNDISKAVLLTSDHLMIEEYQNGPKFHELTKRVNIYRNWGDCYGYYLLSTGFADIMVDPIMSLWDLTALIPIVLGAGGVITDYQGNDAAAGNSTVAAAKGIHAEVIKALN